MEGFSWGDDKDVKLFHRLHILSYLEIATFLIIFGLATYSTTNILLTQNFHPMKTRNIIPAAFMLLLLPVFCMSQWQAEMTSTISGGEQNYKVYSDLSQYRYEFSQDGMNGVVISNPSTNVTAIILLDEKKVHYTETDGMMSSMNDPVQAYNATKVYGEEKILGEENMSGFDCIKKAIYMDEKELYTQWFSEELNFPVRVVAVFADNAYMQLNNIQDWKVDPSLFTVPDDYVEVDEKQRPLIPEPPPPEDWEEIKEAVPVDRSIERGMIINIPIDESVYHRLILENSSDAPAKFSYHSFIDGIELSEDIQGPEEYRTKRLFMGEDYNMTMNWKAGQVIKVKVYEGSLDLKIYKE